VYKPARRPAADQEVRPTRKAKGIRVGLLRAT
jgi:hypothetical protein